MDLSKNQKKIVLISSGQPSLNPRLVKEADALSNAGYAITVLYAYWNEWGTVTDKTLLASKKWKAVRIGGDPQKKRLIYFFSRFINKLCVLLAKTFGIAYFADFAIARASFFLSHEAPKYRADLYIGHNLGALPATVKAAKVNKKPCGFDAEDFHRNEISDDPNDLDVQLKKKIEDKYIPQLAYFTSSSPSISDAYYKLYNQKAPVTLLNVFPINNQIAAPRKAASSEIKLFWFSQTIGLGRGIDDCIEVLRILNNPNIELHLLGFADEDTKKHLHDIAGGNIAIDFHEPVPPDNIALLASGFDIGLALEDNTPLNRDICLTNKIFTYLQAGLAIVASDTTAQKNLLKMYPGTGKLYENGNVKMLATTIRYYCDHKDELYQTKIAAYQIARTELNWEKESEKFLKVISDTLAD